MNKKYSETVEKCKICCTFYFQFLFFKISKNCSFQFSCTGVRLNTNKQGSVAVKNSCSFAEISSLYWGKDVSLLFYSCLPSIIFRLFLTINCQLLLAPLTQLKRCCQISFNNMEFLYVHYNIILLLNGIRSLLVYISAHSK